MLLVPCLPGFLKGPLQTLGPLAVVVSEHLLKIFTLGGQVFAQGAFLGGELIFFGINLAELFLVG